MINPAWYASLAIPLYVCWYIGNDYRKAQSLFQFICDDLIFDKFKKDILKNNREWSIFLFVENLVPLLFLAILLIMVSMDKFPQEKMPILVILTIFSSVIYLIFDITFVNNDMMGVLKDKKLSDIIRDKIHLKDFESMLKTYNTLKDKSFKNDFENYLVEILKKHYKNKR
jgi:hypothetical protein